MSAPEFRTTFEPAHGAAVPLEGGIVRITAPNASPMTFHGTNAYLVGNEELALVDPGPNDDAHFETLMRVIGTRKLKYILATHTHFDHTEIIPRLKDETGATIAGCSPHHAARKIQLGEINHLDAASDKAYAPDMAMAHGDRIKVDGISIEAIATPGHTANHLCFAIGDTGAVLTGDHIMAWATSIIAPPDGSMRDYLASLDIMAARKDKIYLPGHGGRVLNPAQFVRGLKAHRKLRERSIYERLLKGDRTIRNIVAVIYKNTDLRLHGAAALSVMAHMEDLVEKGLVTCDGPLSIEAQYQPVTPIKAKSSSD